MTDTQPIRVRVCFAKGGDLRFTGHLDLQRLFERALRRSRPPLRYSQGFNPKVRLNLASALPLGFSSEAELLDFWLDAPLDHAVVEQRFSAALPADIRIRQVKFVPNDLPSLQASLQSSRYRVTFQPPLDTNELAEKLTALLAQETIPFSRRAKTADLKQLLLSARWQETVDSADLLLEMKSTPEANGRPDELLSLLGLAPGTYQVCRTGMTFNSTEGENNG
ncbi:MAG: TIGR03936 family radical SAM-associated protein [Anaerolineaceae bacterium]